LVAFFRSEIWPDGVEGSTSELGDYIRDFTLVAGEAARL